MVGIFDELNESLFMVDMENAFTKKNIKTKQIIFSENKLKATIITRNNDTIFVEGYGKKFTWKLNALFMGEVCGNEMG